METRTEYLAWWWFSDYYSLVVSATAPEAILELPVSCSEVTDYTRAKQQHVSEVFTLRLHSYTVSPAWLIAYLCVQA